MFDCNNLEMTLFFLLFLERFFSSLSFFQWTQNNKDQAPTLLNNLFSLSKKYTT